MAEDKKSFVAYADWKNQFSLLSDEEAGKLIKHIFSYVNDEDPQFDENERLLKISFEPIKQQLKRDLKKYEKKKESFSEAGKQSGLARKLIGTQLYVLRFFSDDEEFIKVGVTDNSITRRFSSAGDGGFKYGYKFEIVAQFFPKKDGYTVLEMEKIIIKEFKKHSYKPFYRFGGHTECYELTSLNDILKRLTSLNDVQQRSTKRTVNVNDNDTVNVNVNVNDINNIDSMTVGKNQTSIQSNDLDKIYPDEIVEVSTAIELLKSERWRSWRERLGMQLSILPDKMFELFDIFENHLKDHNQFSKSAKDSQMHFKGWYEKVYLKSQTKTDIQKQNNDPNSPPDNSGNWIWYNNAWRDKTRIAPYQLKKILDHISKNESK